jgi:SecD/SecF fusion protein
LAIKRHAESKPLKLYLTKPINEMRNKRRTLYWSLSILIGLIFIYQFSNTDASNEVDQNGGMIVTLEVSIPDLVKSYIRNLNDIDVKRVFELARKKTTKGDFIEQFVAAHQELNNGKRLVSYLNYAEIEELDLSSTDDDVLEFLMKQKVSSMRGFKSIMESRINHFGISQPNVQVDLLNNRIYIELPGVHDDFMVANALFSTANLQFFETFEYAEIKAVWSQANALSLSPEVRASDLEDELPVAHVNDSIDENRNLDSLSNIRLEPLSNGDTDVLQGLDFLTSTYGNNFFVKLEDRAEVDYILRQRKDISNLFPNNLLFMWGAKSEKHSQTNETGYIIYPIKVPQDGRPKVGGKDLKMASVGYNSEDGRVTINVEMTYEGDAKWAQMTASNIDRAIAITMDSLVYSAPNVLGPIRGGRTEISGSFSMSEAKDLVGLLNGGILPVPCQVISVKKL